MKSTLTTNDFLAHNLSPVPKQMFVWFVNREDGSSAYEFTNDGENHDYNKEVDDRKDEIKEFGLLGNGSKIYFNTKDGIIHIGDRKIKLFVESDEDINVYLRLTENDEANYKNVIQYKKAAFDYNPVPGVAQTIPGTVTNHYIGYNCETEHFSFQVILDTPVGQPMELKTTITMKTTDFEGKICMQSWKDDEINYYEEEDVKLEQFKVVENKFVLLNI